MGESRADQPASADLTVKPKIKIAFLSGTPELNGLLIERMREIYPELPLWLVWSQRDRTFVVTGGSSGLGAATASLIGKRGGRVVIADLNADAGEAVANGIGRDRALFTKTDVIDEASVRSAIEEATKFGELRGVVNCAGIAIAERIVGKRGAHDLNSFVRVIQVNLVGTFNVMRLAAAAMVGQAATETGWGP